MDRRFTKKCHTQKDVPIVQEIESKMLKRPEAIKQALDLFRKSLPPTSAKRALIERFSFLLALGREDFANRCIDKYFDEPDDKDNQLIHPMPKDRQG